MRRILSEIEYRLLRAILLLFGMLPLELHYLNAIWLDFLIRKVFRYRTALVEENLRCSFPDKSEEERGQILKDFYRHFAEIIVEAIWFGACRNPKRLLRSHIVEVENLKEVTGRLDKAPGVMVLYTHAGNWELLGGMCYYETNEGSNDIGQEKPCFIYRKQHSEVWDRILLENRLAPVTEKEKFDGYVESKAMVRYMLTHRNEPKMYNVNTDQHPYFNAPDYLKINFLGRDCHSMSAAAAIACKLSLPVYFQHMDRKQGFGYVVRYELICEDASSMSAEDIMKEYYRLLEADIKNQPENYLWTHNRWWMG